MVTEAKRKAIKRWRAQNEDKVSAYNEKWRDENKEHVNEYQKKYRLKNKKKK